jgi:hypothetical protein
MRYNYALSAVALLAFVQLMASAGAQSDALSLANLAVYPQPAVAGSNITLAFQLYNSYTNELTSVNLNLQGSYPILNYSPSATYLISTIGQGLYGGSVPFTYRIHLPKNMNAGTYTVDVVASYETQGAGNQQVSSSSVMPVTFYVRGAPNLKLTASSSAAISPGSQSAVTVTVLNVGTDNATDVGITLLNSQNFSVLGASTFNLGTVGPQKSATAAAVLLANSTLKEGTATFPMVVSYSTTYNSTLKSYNQSVPVTVSLGVPNIVLGITGATPSSLYPGTNQTLSMSVQNIGSGTAKNVTISVPSTGNITASSSASMIFLGTIAAGASTTTSVQITANKNDQLSKYLLPIRLSYQNANYNSTTNKTVTVPIALQSIAQFNITSASSALSPGSTYMPITVTVRNNGNEPAQTVTFSLQTIYPISQVTPNAYLNSLAPGQSANVTFYVNVDSQANAGQYPLTLYEQWTQPGGTTTQQYSASQNYYVSVNSGGGIENSLIYAIIVIVIVAVVYMRVIKPRMAAQKKKEKK